MVFILTTLKKRHVIDKGGRQGGYLDFFHLLLQRVLLQDEVFELEEGLAYTQHHLCPMLRVHLV